MTVGTGTPMGPWLATDPRQHRDRDLKRDRKRVSSDSLGSWPETDEAGSLECQHED